jgi:hypothetical protein
MTNQTQEALKMAIEVMTKADNYFEKLCSLLITFGVSPSELNMQKDTFLIKPINACKEALEQPAWQELTDDEVKKVYDNSLIVHSDTHYEFNNFKFARAIEQALKDKNT